ncbi:MAG: c-type cytochrome [Proteobacteria bacterium]|jgi:mono/diheme cytochrome c family protein|nr:c-type cytochrome [Pseudomonadota bacterium]
MPSPFYAAMSDADVKAIVAYLRTIKPVKNVIPKSEYYIPLPANYGPKVGSVPEISKDDPVAYGEYLAHSLGHCTECHTPVVEGHTDFNLLNAGGRILPNVSGLGFTAVSRNITPHPETGIGQWTDEEIKRAITKGISRDGRELLNVMAFSYYDKMSDEDIDALVAYLRSVPPL